MDGCYHRLFPHRCRAGRAGVWLAGGPHWAREGHGLQHPHLLVGDRFWLFRTESNPARSGAVYLGAGHGRAMVAGCGAGHGVLAGEMASDAGRGHGRGGQCRLSAGRSHGPDAPGHTGIVAVDDAGGGHAGVPGRVHHVFCAGVRAVEAISRHGQEPAFARSLRSRLAQTQHPGYRICIGGAHRDVGIGPMAAAMGQPDGLGKGLPGIESSAAELVCSEWQRAAGGGSGPEERPKPRSRRPARRLRTCK